MGIEWWLENDDLDLEVFQMLFVDRADEERVAERESSIETLHLPRKTLRFYKGLARGEDDDPWCEMFCICGIRKSDDMS